MSGGMLKLLIQSAGLCEEDIEEIAVVGKEVSQLPIKLNRIESKLDAIISHLDIDYVEPDQDEQLLIGEQNGE